MRVKALTVMSAVSFDRLVTLEEDDRQILCDETLKGQSESCSYLLHCFPVNELSSDLFLWRSESKLAVCCMLFYCNL